MKNPVTTVKLIENRKASVFLKNFILCGVTGWCMEITYTSLVALRHRNMMLTGVTSLWMFPIYGCAAVFAPLSRLLKKRSLLFRGLTYMSLIFSAEYLSGHLLNLLGIRPWDYGNSRFHIHHNIRLDFAPLWFGAGLFFERILRHP